jgi:hypothetical protein
MKFSTVVEQVLEVLQRQKRISYRALKREFELDDDYIEDLKAEIIDAKRLAVDEDGKVLVWTGTSPVSSSTFQVSGFHSPTPNPQEEAEACFLKAIEIARRQQAKSLELRATMSLARLWQQQGKHHAARNMLSEIYGWFTEGFDTKDLQEVKALLDEMA